MKYTELDYMRACDRRGLYKNNIQQKRRLIRLEKGHQGERIAREWIEAYLEKHQMNATILSDIYLQSSTKIQTDLLVICQGLWWIVEVKNYDGIYRKVGHQTYLNNFLIERNEIDHCYTRLNIFKAVANAYQLNKINIHLTMVLIHENSELEMDAYPQDIYIVTRNQFRRHIKTVLKPLKDGTPIDRSLEIIANERKETNFQLDLVSLTNIHDLNRGVICPHCQQLTHRFTQMKLHCEYCKRKSNKLNAAIALLEELHYLWPDEKMAEYFNLARHLTDDNISLRTFYKAQRLIRMRASNENNN